MARAGFKQEVLGPFIKELLAIFSPGRGNQEKPFRGENFEKFSQELHGTFLVGKGYIS